MSKQGDEDATKARVEARVALVNTPVQKPPPTLHESGEKYDRKYGGFRHLHVRCAYGVYEAAWEGTPLDQHRVHALDRDKSEAEAKLHKALLRRIETSKSR